MKKSALVIAAGLLLPGLSPAASQYGLPVRLGSSPAEVRKILGQPNEVIAAPGHEGMQGMGDEWYDSSGILAGFKNGKLASITLFRGSDYKEFVPYEGPIINGVKLSDSKKVILEKMGKPTKIEEERLGDGTDPDRPVVNPQRSTYYWRSSDYTLKVIFLFQAQLISEVGPITVPKDTVLFMIVYK
jgi:hypothetical protein